MWRDFYTGEEVNKSLGITDGGDIEDCTIMNPYLDGWSDWSCVINKV